MRVLIAIAALALAVPAAAQTPATSLVLADASSAPSGRVIIDGAGWTCNETGACTAFGGREQPADRACRRVVARLGAVTAFTWKGQELNEQQIAACNTSAA
ncbi:CC_3452 family protein [Brevundimonas sp.]|uniref:CC_3452 family protein n=1 Tax=Brevundimonas sp. TaxID=1871086 RepID=UPI0039195EE8